MTPLQRIAMGLVIVVVDPVIAGYDAVPDVLGWVLVVLGLSNLRARLRGIAALLTLAVVSGTISLLLLAPQVTRSVDESAGWYLSLPFLVFCIVLCGAMAELVEGDEPGVARRFTSLRWVFVVLVPAPAVLYGGELDHLSAVTGAVGLAAVAANVYLIYLLFRSSGQAPAVSSNP